MSGPVVTGAAIAAIISLLTTITAMLSQTGVTQLSDISQASWIVAFSGAAGAFLKDYYAILTRQTAARTVGKTYDPKPKASATPQPEEDLHP